MDKSLEILQCSTDTIRKQYVVSDLIKEYSGNTHDSQFHIQADNSI